MIDVRPYQSAALRDLERLWVFRRRILLVLPTGGGKTVVAAHVIDREISRNGRVLFVAHRRELIAQCHQKLVDQGVPPAFIGVIMAGDARRNPFAPIQVASIDTLRRRDLPNAQLLVFDEAHRCLAASYQKLADAYPAARVLGLTATPYRQDGRGLGARYDHLLVVAQPPDLIDDGFLDAPIIYGVRPQSLPTLDGIKRSKGDYETGALGRACNQRKLVGAIVSHWKERAEGRRTVAFAVNVEHSKDLAREFRDAGVRAAHLDGETSHDERAKILYMLEQGELELVSNCDVLTEGWDQPPVKCAILARPTMSLRVALQQEGRILRPWNGIKPLILDHAHITAMHGFPQDVRDFSLDGIREKKAAKGAPPMKVCPACYQYQHAARSECLCGYVFVTENRTKVDEKTVLVLLTPEDGPKKREFYTWLCGEAETHGYAEGWAFHRFKAKYGHAPLAEWVRESASPELRARRYADWCREGKEKRFKQGYADARYRAIYGCWPDDEIRMRASLATA